MTIKEAISHIVTYATLPHQIDSDARGTWKRKADEAKEYLMSLYDCNRHLKSARKEIDEYYDNPNSYLNELF